MRTLYDRMGQWIADRPSRALVLVLLLMFFVLPVLMVVVSITRGDAIPCSCQCAEGEQFTPTPTLQWRERPEDVGVVTGYRLYYLAPGRDSAWRFAGELPCQTYDRDGDEIPDRHCPGVDTSIPVQRYVPAEDHGIELDFTVRAVQPDGSEYSPWPEALHICAPCLWEVGQPLPPCAANR